MLLYFSEFNSKIRLFMHPNSLSLYKYLYNYASVLYSSLFTKI